MCGIFGFVNWDQLPADREGKLHQMQQALVHRGPDALGAWSDDQCALGCRRLRIVDLRSAADQPFVSADERYVLVCNGEIYNTRRLRQRYPEYPFVSHSDVESLLPLIQEHGVEALEQAEGMFAIAVWDRRERALSLVRDRAGEKPLFIYSTPGGLAFASEIQALFSLGLARDLDQDAIAEYLDLGFICEPRTPFRDVRKVESGVVFTHTASGSRDHRFWPEFLDTPEGHDTSHETFGSAEDLERLLESATRRQLQGDQPVGLFLSGGVDSSLLASLVSDLLSGEQRLSFSARFADARFDEESWAERAASHCGFRHRHVLIDEISLARAFEEVTTRICEPVADPAILPTFLLAERAREEVPVILGGEGADELFGGYPTYLGHRFAGPYRKVPTFFRAPVRHLIDRLPTSHGKVPISFLAKKFVESAERDWQQRHESWLGPSLLETGPTESAASRGAEPRSVTDAAWWPSLGARQSDFRKAMLLDFFGYLRENLLVKLDRACMLNSVESRAPYLDVDIVRFAWQLRDRDLIRGLRTKDLLKRVARRRLPRALVDRRKRGLSVPIADWIDQGLRDEVDHLLDPERLRRQGLFAGREVTGLIEAHRSGKQDASRRLWPFITLQKWIDAWVPELGR